MNANEIVAIVLAVSCERSAWGTKRFAVPVCGTPALARVRRVLADAGLSEVLLVTDGPAEVEAVGAWTRVVRPDACLEMGALDDRPVLLLCGDLPLLTAATVRSFADAFAKSRASRLVESSGVLSFWRTGADAASSLAAVIAAFDAPDGPFGRGTWKVAAADDVRRLAVPGAYATICAVARLRVLARLGDAGVLVVDPLQTYVDDEAAIGADTVIYPGTYVTGSSRIGSRCRVGPDSWIESSMIEDDAVVRYSVLEEARVRERSTIGPFAHLRRGSDVGPEARVGNFVEVKASRLGRGVKAGHLSYLGDAEVGADSNIGAGTITCNFDGEAKHRTVIEDDVFVGSNTSLVAPVTVGRGAVIGAGSTITEDVPPGTLAIARARQVLKERRERASGEDT